MGVKEKKLEMDSKYFSLLGFTQNIYNGTKLNFSIVTYALSGQIASTILHAQNIAAKLPKETLLIYDLGLSEDDLHILNGFCNNSRCNVINYDFSQFPSYIMDEKSHAFRPIIIKDALSRSKTILFTENYIRLKGTNKNFDSIIKRTEDKDRGVSGWSLRPIQPVSSHTHPKMFEYFNLDADSFYFVPLLSMDIVFFHHNSLVNDKIMLPLLKCVLTPECLHPIGEFLIYLRAEN